jgi:tripartite-type tricarboxylate transporter receptor subunit TctC
MPRLLACLFLASLAPLAAAQEYPARAVHITVPFTPGTGADILARILGPKLGERWKVPVVTENRVGATGNIGTEFVAKSAPDGYTLLFTATSFGTNPALSRNLPFDPVKSFAPVVLVANSTLCVLVHPGLAARNMRELIELAKRKPGELHYASPGNGGPQHLAMELIKLETGIDLVHVPYKGFGGALSDLIGGHVQAMVSALQSAAPQVQSGKLRMLAVMSPERSAAFPDVPTMREQGLPQLEVETWYGILAPAGTPQPAIARVNADVNALLATPEVKDLLAKQALTAAGGSPERLGERIREELARWTRVVNASNIKAD